VKQRNMTDRKFLKALILVIGAGLFLTAAHLSYIIYAYRHCSIIYFIAKELW